MNISLPSRYEDLDEAFRGRLEPNRPLLDEIQSGIKSIEINKGIRFLPIFGESGSGKSCASREIDRHLPATHVFVLERNEIENDLALKERISTEKRLNDGKYLIAVVDQFEESVKGKEDIPTQFVEKISILDRTEFKDLPLIFLWLTTDRNFQKNLERATSRNSRLLLSGDFTIVGPPRADWLRIISDTFSFHNKDAPLADYGIVEQDIEKQCKVSNTVGEALEQVGRKLAESIPSIQNLSDYRVILVWPVADGTRMQRVLQFTRPKEGYLLNCDAWLREFNDMDKKTLPMREYNRTRLYFDMRLVPLRVAEIHKLCADLENDNVVFGKTYLDWFKNTHLFQIISGSWDSYDYSPVRERESKRSKEAKIWYDNTTKKPVLIGKRLSKVISELGEDAVYEKEIPSPYSKVKVDIYIEESERNSKRQIIELKVFSSENTMPSSIRDQIKTTLRRHAQFAGFLQKQ
jgi:adenylate kinase family enzyme